MGKTFWAASALFLGLQGCIPANSDDTLTGENLRNRLEGLQTRLEQLEKRSARRDLILESEATAYLTPTNQGYSVLQTEMGALTVNLEGLEPVGGGTKVTLRFGNVSNATLDQVTATIEWGKANDGFKSEASGTQAVRFSSAFPRGQWIDVDFVINDVLPAQIAFVRIKDLEHAGISLLGRPSPESRAKD